MRLIFLVILLNMLIVSGVKAETYTIILDEIVGEYPYIDENEKISAERSQIFTYPGPAAKIKTIRIYLEGTASAGSLSCCDWMCDTTAWYIDASAFLERVNKPGLWLGGYYGSVEGPFSGPGGLYPLPGTGNSFGVLEAGERLEYDQYFGPSGYILMCSPITEPPGGEITSARIEITVDIIVPVENTTWGRIKSLYEY